MRHLIIFLLLPILVGCNAQNPTKEFIFKEVGWTLFIPATSNFLDSAQFDTIQRKAVNAINSTYNADIDFNEVRPLFTIRQGQFNIFGSTLNPYDSTLFKTWEESYKASKEMIVDLINQQGPEIRIVDTASSTEQIDGLTFETFYLKTVYPQKNLTMYSYWFYRKINNYDFSINVSYVDESIGRNYLSIVKASKFSK